VVQVEQALEGEDTILISTGREARLSAETADVPAALQGVSFFGTEVAGRTCRVAVVAPSAEEALTVIERSASQAEAAVASPKRRVPWRSRASSSAPWIRRAAARPGLSRAGSPLCRHGPGAL